MLMKDTLHENINPLVISKGKKITLAMLLIEKIASLGAMTFLPSRVNDEVLESTKKKKKKSTGWSSMLWGLFSFL